MKNYLSLRAIASWTRPNRWADHRGIDRQEKDGAFAGLAASGRYYVVALHDYSAEGACLDARGVERIGERVKVTSNHFNREGRVCWIANGRVGVEFDLGR